MQDCKKTLLKHGAWFAEHSGQSRTRTADVGAPFVRDGATVSWYLLCSFFLPEAAFQSIAPSPLPSPRSTLQLMGGAAVMSAPRPAATLAQILVHGSSRVVSATLLAAQRTGKQFSVVLTECSGGPAAEKQDVEEQAELYRRSGILVTLVPDAAVASIIDQVDLAMVGAEAVVESGGVISRTGTYQLGIICKATETPFYVAAESIKFARLYPLNQQDLPAAVLKNPRTCARIGRCSRSPRSGCTLPSATTPRRSTSPCSSPTWVSSRPPP